MAANQYDAIVIGAGHNGLIAGAYLARAGKRVVILERREVVGGAAVTEEIFPGYRFTEFSYVVSLLRPEIIRELELARHGLKILPLPSTVTPMDNGEYLAQWADHDQTRREIYRHSPRDAEAYDEYSLVMARAAKAIKPVLGLVPPDPSSMSPRDLLGLLKLGKYAKSLREKELYRIAKLITQSSADLLNEWFEFGPLKGTKSASGIIGTFLGPHSPGTAYVLLHHYMGEIDGAFRAWGFAKNGSGGVSAAIAASARALGAEIRTGASVSQVIVKGGRAAGVALENGDELRANVVLSAADPKRSFLQFVESKHFPDEFVQQIRNFRARGSSGKVNIALSELPEFTCLPGDTPLHRGAISISPSIEYIERAYDEAKYGQFSKNPYIDMIIPSMIDRDMAPPGHHVMSCFVQYTPYDIEGGWDDQKRDAFGEAVISTLERYAPNIRRAIVGKQVITPKDIERIAGITGGNIFHGELLLHQLFFLRPAPQWADFRTPLPGYYFGASGAHPGGGVMGAAGKMAAQEALKDRNQAMAKFDVIVIGAGLNGLVAANYLARAGKKVLVLERRGIAGGQAVTEAFVNGQQVDLLHAGGQLRPDIVRDLDLAKHGLPQSISDPLISILPDGRQLRLTADAGDQQTLASIGSLSRRDAEGWPAFVAFMTQATAFLDEAYRTPMPRMKNVKLAEGLPLAKLALKLRRLGPKDMFRVIRALPMSALELTEEWFESDQVRAAVAAVAVHGVTLGPMSAGTGYTLIHNWLNRGGPGHRHVEGGVGRIADALVVALKAHGGEIRLSAGVTNVLVEDSRVRGVRLMDGEEIFAPHAVSAADPRHTLLDLVGAPELPPEFVWHTQSIKMRGSVAKVHLLTDGSHGLPEGTLVVAPSIRYLERAYDAAKYGKMSTEPYLEITTAGRVVSLHVQFAPYALRERDWGQEHTVLERRAIDAATGMFPRLGASISDIGSLTPLDIENDYGLTEGDLNHGQLILDQMFFMRPLPGWSNHRTPIDGLYLCGNGVHGGGGISGASGRNAAREIIADLQKKRVGRA